jgi:hypothetical protein
MTARYLRLSLILAAMLALPGAALASTARVEGMTLPNDYIKDYTNLYTYLSDVSSVGNLIYAELGDQRGTPGVNNDRGVGAVLGNLWDGRFGTWAIHMRQLTPALGMGDTTQNYPGSLNDDPNSHSNETFDLMWGRRFGTMALGLRLNRSYYRDEDAIPPVTTNLVYDVPSGGDPNLARNIMGYGVGAGFEFSPNATLEAAIHYQDRTFEQGIAGVVYDEDGGATWLASARMLWQWQPNVLVVPVFKFYGYDLSTATTPPGGPSVLFDNSLRGWEAGIAGNWTIGSNDLFVLGMAFAQNTVEQQNDLFGIGTAFGVSDTLEVTETLAPQIFAALETNINSWLTLRVGAQKGTFNSLKVQDESIVGGSRTIHSSPFVMNIGAGVKLGPLQLDAVMRGDFPQTLGGMFSNTANYAAFPKVSATYGF